MVGINIFEQLLDGENRSEIPRGHAILQGLCFGEWGRTVLGRVEQWLSSVVLLYSSPVTHQSLPYKMVELIFN